MFTPSGGSGTAGAAGVVAAVSAAVAPVEAGAGAAPAAGAPAAFGGSCGRPSGAAAAGGAETGGGVAPSAGAPIAGPPMSDALAPCGGGVVAPDCGGACGGGAAGRVAEHAGASTSSPSPTEPATIERSSMAPYMRLRAKGANSKQTRKIGLRRVSRGGCGPHLRTAVLDAPGQTRLTPGSPRSKSGRAPETDALQTRHHRLRPGWALVVRWARRLGRGSASGDGRGDARVRAERHPRVFLGLPGPRAHGPGRGQLLPRGAPRVRSLARVQRPLRLLPLRRVLRRQVPLQGARPHALLHGPGRVVARGAEPAGQSQVVERRRQSVRRPGQASLPRVGVELR